MERDSVHSYKYFNVSVYVPVHNVNEMTDFQEFDKAFSHLEKNIRIGRVYIENFRGEQWATEEQLLRVKDYFEKKGIAVSGGLTPVGVRLPGRDGSVSLCYSKPYDEEKLLRAVEMNARLFDEFIFDDFFFLNCRCAECVKKRGNRTWAEFRLTEKKRIIEDLVMGPAHRINPNVNVILKYPQWFEVFNELGYDLGMEPPMFDSIYTGTETRNPLYGQQHLPKYLSYFTMRLYEAAAPGRNLGGWFDPYESTYSLTSYLEQGYLTLFGKAKEAMLFCLGSLLKSATDFRLFAPAVGEMFAEADEYLGDLGSPVGVPAYLPQNARGEDNIHSYLGMIGFPTEPVMQYPFDAKTVFLAQGALMDPDIAEKMEQTLLSGGDVIVTSNFVRKMGLEKFRQFAYVDVTDRKALVTNYGVSYDTGGSISGVYPGRKPVLLTQIDAGVNDIWEQACAWGEDNNFPIVLRTNYGDGRIIVITIPDDYGDLYNYPDEVLHAIRSQADKTMKYILDAPSRIQLFVYDNDKAIIRSDFENVTWVSLEVPEGKTQAVDLVSKRSFAVTNGKIRFRANPGVNYVLDIR
ncbi:MAG: hypothetical protein IKS18_07260 [Lachnospiraceae bacterium]|nr:hypothetical protein [Lachnospiraceae bacterium]